MKQEVFTKKKEIVEFFLKKGILLSNDILLKLEDIDEEKLNILSKKITSPDLLILNDDIVNLLNDIYNTQDINWLDLEQSRAFSEKGKESSYGRFLEAISKTSVEIKTDERYPVRVVFTYRNEIKKWTPEDFIEHFNVRFRSLEKLLRKRQELTSLTSINKLMSKREKENVSLIGMVQKKEFTKNNNLILTIEDNTGNIKIIVNKNKPQLFEETQKIVLDEVIGIIGVVSNGVVFANNVIWPEIPANRELKKCSDECYAIFLSDLHIGSRYFMEEEFVRFIKWLNLEIGDEHQRGIAEKVGYIFLVGDIIDGCGVYPGQEDDLLIKDVKMQYSECARFLRSIPSHIRIIMCAGNHDAMRLTEPQMPLYREYAEELYKLPNLVSVSNPSLVNIHARGNFQGFDVLLYHGYSFDYYVANVDYIRNNGGYDRVDLIMKFLLQRRHLAPTHSSNSYIPDTKLDSLVIESIPDIFVTGHIHKAMLTNFRGITMICASCWQSLTEYQKRHGHKPDPCRVPIVNLKTREARIMRFGK